VSLEFQVAAKTDVGCVRLRNEDNFGYDLDRGVFVVCDGMGGHAAGEVASKIAVDSVLEYFRQLPPSELQHIPAEAPAENLSVRAQALSQAIQLANTAIHEAACRDQEHAGMGSTVVCVLADEDCFSVGHVGDSRVYLIRQGAIEQLTQDHSFVTEKLRLGLISAEQARKSSMQNVITRALGVEETVEPELDDIVSAPDDVLVLASDGLTRSLNEQDILTAVSKADALGNACEELIQSAKNAGGEDNITCLLIRFVEPRWYEHCLRNFRIGGSR
jgi:serine/threonine protein phosphatase PrpC